MTMSLKKVSAFALSAVMLSGVVACSSTKEPETKASDKPASSSPGASPSGSGAANKKIEVSSMTFTYSNPSPIDGQGLKMVNEKFNVDLKPSIIPYADYQQKLAATIASGSIPDIVMIEDPSQGFYKWAKQGAFLDLKEYVDKYESLKRIPKEIWDAVTVDGKIIGIPRYYPSIYNDQIMIRKDWLDNLGLKEPTNFEELKQVAIAFTKNDPDKNGKDDTYGMVMSANLWPYYNASAYYTGSAWYHKNSDGQIIPGYIDPSRKEYISFLADVYKAGAMTKDFPVVKNVVDSAKDFWTSKAGIYRISARGMSETDMKSLTDAAPGAKVIPIPPFKAADGSQGHVAQAGYYGITTLSAKLKGDKDKIERILQMLDFGRQFYSIDQRNDSNKDYDWLYGLKGQGYQIMDGKVVPSKPEEGKAPFNYLVDIVGWPKQDADNQYSKIYIAPQLKEAIEIVEKYDGTYKHFVDPTFRVFVESLSTKYPELVQKHIDEEVKIVVGERPLSDWDKLPQEFMNKGGAQIVKEVNDAIKAAGFDPISWK